jgi:rRNA maturation endonuclease Nob1
MGKISREILYHFRCEACQKWWSIGDAPAGKKSWYCPWCGILQTFEIVTENKPADAPHNITSQQKSDT